MLVWLASCIENARGMFGVFFSGKQIGVGEEGLQW